MEIDTRNIEILEKDVVKILKTKTPEERLKMAFDMWKMVKRQLEHYFKMTHKEWNEKRVQQEVAKRMSHGPV